MPPCAAPAPSGAAALPGAPPWPDSLAGRFAGKATADRLRRTAELLQTLVALGQARATGEGQFTAG